MSKKKAVKKKDKMAGWKPKAKAAKKGARVWESRRGTERAAAAKKTTRVPAQVPLIRGLRIPALDRDCRHIADTRAAIARLQAEEADLERIAHENMKKHRQTTWQSAGVTLVRVPGEERLRVTTSRSSGSTTPAEPKPPVADDVEEGASEDDVQEAAGELEDAIVRDEVDEFDETPEVER